MNPTQFNIINRFRLSSEKDTHKIRQLLSDYANDFMLDSPYAFTALQREVLVLGYTFGTLTYDHVLDTALRIRQARYPKPKQRKATRVKKYRIDGNQKIRIS
jgi:hypothetical protein